MSTDYKVIHGRINTKGRTIPEIRIANKGQEMNYRDFENLQKMYEVLDGAEAVFRLWERDEFKAHHLAGWDKQYDQQIMMGMYYAEQTNPFQELYKNNFAQFEADWKADEYDTTCAFALYQGDVETIQVLKEAGESA
jgi:hypothetical protein